VKRFVSLQFLNPKTVDRTPWTGIGPSHGHYVTQDNTNADIDALSGIRSHDPSVRESEDSSREVNQTPQ
jgi:hypothetical protein